MNKNGLTNCDEKSTRDLRLTGPFWENVIADAHWHFDTSIAETLSVGHMDISDVGSLIALADAGTEKTVMTSLPHAKPDDHLSTGIKNDIRSLAQSAGYPNSMVYSVVNDLFNLQNSRAAELGTRVGLRSCYLKVHKQLPGQLWPLHVDNFHAFRSAKPEEQAIRRFIVALNNWCWGQMFQLGNATWSRWGVGDFVEIKRGVPHSSANTSPLCRYSLVLTGISDEP